MSDLKGAIAWAEAKAALTPDPAERNALRVLLAAVVPASDDAATVIAQWAVSLAPLAPEDVDDNGRPAEWLVHEARERVLPRLVLRNSRPGMGEMGG